MLSDGTWTYTWKQGRQLASMSGSGTWNFTYDADGMRTKRTNGSTTYSYIYDGSQLSAMSVGSNQLYFSYDAFGTPQAVVYNGTQYRYITNLQGDIVEIRDANDSTVVRYTYDAWGKILTTTGSLASTLGTHNPLRYRGYVYDTETGLYYLQSRYYNPTIGRFINADAFAATGQGLLGNNMFVYCLNNPSSNCDPHGTSTISVTNGDWNPLFIGHYGLGGGCGGGYGGNIGGGGPRQPTHVLEKSVADAAKYVTNTDEQVVLEAEHFAFYKGTLVIRHSSDYLTSWALFGTIMLNRDESDPNELMHEKGHIIQEILVGSDKYLLTVFIPSATYNFASRENSFLFDNYYNMPWEYSADVFGGAVRSHSDWSKIAAILYFSLFGGRG